ncbi:MAG TPA: hypothetical protein VGI55_06315, partial [Solirubrobacteraceae bacterium]
MHAAATFAFGPLDQVELDDWRGIQAVNVASEGAPIGMARTLAATVVAPLQRTNSSSSRMAAAPGARPGNAEVA